MKPTRILPGALVLLAIAAACTGSDPASPDDGATTQDGGTSTSGTAGQNGTSGTAGTSSSGALEAGPAAAQFTIALDPKSVIVPKVGGPIGVAVTIARSPGFDGKVSLEVAGLPRGLIAESDPISGASGVLNLSGNGAAPGISKVTVVAKAIGGTTTASTPLDVLVGDDPGKRDVSFGGGEVVFQASDGASFVPAGLVTQPDGKVVVAGTVSAGSAQHFQLVRFDSDGSLDATFGTAGATVLDDTGLGHLSAFALQPKSGGFVAVGDIFEGTQIAKAIRFDANGVVDATFGKAGVARISWSDEESNRATRSESVRALPDDSFIWIATHNSDTEESDTGDVAHFTAGGAVDVDWGSDNHITTFACEVDGLVGGTSFHTAVPLADDTFLVAGACGGSEDVYQPVTLFQRFDEAGTAITPGSNFEQLQIATTGGIVQSIRAVGSSNTVSVGDIDEGSQVTHLLVVDLTQSTSQISKLVLKTSDRDRAHGIAGLTNGNYVVLAGGSPLFPDGGLGNASTVQSRVLRLKDRGTQDLDWGAGGAQKGIVDVFAEGTLPVGIAVQPDQRIVVLGSTPSDKGPIKAVLRRLWP